MSRSTAILCTLLATGLLAPAAQQNGPRIEFDSTAKSIAKVFDGEIITQVFKFANRGDSQLEITSVEPSCGCTSALPVPNKVAPGQSGQIKVEIKTENFASQSRKLDETISVSKTVTVRTNDAGHPQVVLTVNFDVAPEIVASEPAMDFGKNPRGKEVARELTLEIAPDRPVKLLSAVSTDASVSARLEPLEGAGEKKYRLIATLKPTAAEGVHFGNIVIKTTSRLKPQLIINIRGIVTKSSDDPGQSVARSFGNSPAFADLSPSGA